MEELIILSVVALVALALASFTAYGVTFIRKRWAQEVSPMLGQVNEMLKSKPLHQLNQTLDTVYLAIDEKTAAIDAHIIWFKNYASTAPTVMLDHVEGIINEKAEVFGGHMESVMADAKDEVLEFANAYGQQAMVAGAKLLQGRGASLLGKKGREKSLANAQIKRGKDEMMKQALQSQLPEGISVDMVEGIAERFGYTLEEAQQALPMIMKMFPNALLPGGNGPMQAAPPSPQAQPPSQTKSLWG